MASLVSIHVGGLEVNSRRDGCTTDKVLDNIKAKLDGNIDDLDGLETLTYASPGREGH